MLCVHAQMCTPSHITEQTETKSRLFALIGDKEWSLFASAYRPVFHSVSLSPSSFLHRPHSVDTGSHTNLQMCTSLKCFFSSGDLFALGEKIRATKCQNIL